MITLVAFMSTYHRFVNRVQINMDLMKLMIEIYKYYSDQKTKTEEARAKLEENQRDSHKKKKKKKRQRMLEEEEPSPEELYLQVPAEAADTIQMGVACFPIEFV